MRSGMLALALAAPLAACAGGGDGPSGPADQVPPTVEVTSPARGTLLEGQPTVLVTGRALDDVGVAAVSVNGQAAALEPDGSFSLTVELAEGITLLETVASDAAGNQAADARAVLAGTLVEQATPVTAGLAAHLSSPAMAGLAVMVADLAGGVDWTALARSYNPVSESGGGSCNSYKAYVDSVEHGGFEVSAGAADGGIAGTITVRDLVVRGHVNWRAFCGNGTTNYIITADAYDVTALIAPRLEAGAILVALEGVTSQFRGFRLDASGVPGFVEDAFEDDVRDKLAEILRDKIRDIVPPLATDFLSEFLADAWEVTLLGRTLQIAVEPASMSWTAEGGTIVLDTSAEVAGAEGSSYLSTPRSPPSPADMASDGLRLAVADDVLNQLLAGMWASGAFEDAMVPVEPGAIGAAIGADVASAAVTLMLPPVASFDTSTGTSRLTIGDLIVTAVGPSGDTMASFVMSAEIDLAIEARSDGGLKIVTRTPRILAQVLEQSPSLLTPLDAQKVAAIAELAIVQMSLLADSLLESLPIPGVPGGSFTAPTFQPAGGYLLLGGQLAFE